MSTNFLLAPFFSPPFHEKPGRCQAFFFLLAMKSSYGAQVRSRARLCCAAKRTLDGFCAPCNADVQQKEKCACGATDSPNLLAFHSHSVGPIWPGACCDPGGRCYLDDGLEKHLSPVGQGGDAVARIRLRRSQPSGNRYAEANCSMLWSVLQLRNGS